MNRGTIALDIDGTIAGEDRLLPDRVTSYLEELHREGWQFILATGRTLSFAIKTLKKLPFSFLLGVQNGADLLVMPEKKLVSQNYIEQGIINLLDCLYKGKQEDFIVYAGWRQGDFCYYRPQRFSSGMSTYLEELKALSPSPWQPVTTFNDIQGQTLFPLIKCFGSEKECQIIEKELRAHGKITTSVIQDPIDPSIHLLLITHKNANKGATVNFFMRAFRLRSPLITAGDDNNDIPLLKVGDIRIAMEKSPDALHHMADIIAPSAKLGGIVEGLRKAISRINA